MSQADLVTDLKVSLNDAATSFRSDQDFTRHLDHAALDFGRVRPRVLPGSVALVADQDEYAAPADAIDEHSMQWGKNKKRDLKPWDAAWPGALPRMDIVGDPGSRRLVLSPAPSAHQITVLGSTCPFRYFAAHKIDSMSANTTIRPEDRALLLLRAAAESMKELAHRSVTKAQKVGSSLFASPKTGTPAGLYDQLMRDFERMATS